MSRAKKDIARARRLQDDYALAERHYQRSKARGQRNSAFRKKDEALGRKVHARQRKDAACSGRNEGRVEGFLAGAFVTAIAWIFKARS